MSFSLNNERRFRFGQPGWSGVAFIVEALLLLLFLAASTAIFVRLFAGASAQSSEALTLTRAVAAAQSTAERFCADPEGIVREYTEEDLVVLCDVTPEEYGQGTMFQAEIRVYAADDVVSAVVGMAPGTSGEEPPGAAEGSWPNDAPHAIVPVEGAEPIYTLSTCVYRGGDAA